MPIAGSQVDKHSIGRIVPFGLISILDFIERENDQQYVEGIDSEVERCSSPA